MNESIFGSLARTRTPSPAQPARRAPPAQPVPRAARCTQQPTAQSKPQTWSTSSEVALLAILEAPLQLGETVAVGFARKEAELRHVFATLSVIESRALHLRLSQPKSGDHLAESFRRLTADRRERLLNFIADARRRAAMTR